MPDDGYADHVHTADGWCACGDLILEGDRWIVERMYHEDCEDCRQLAHYAALQTPDDQGWVQATLRLSFAPVLVSTGHGADLMRAKPVQAGISEGGGTP